MDTSILRLATKRVIGSRTWDNLRLGIDTGYVSFRSGLTYHPPQKGLWFWWDFHKHHGGAGGLAVPANKTKIKEMARNLMKHQIKKENNNE